MNKKILIVKNCTQEGPWTIQTVLDGKRIFSQTVDLEMGQHFPTPHGYGAIIVLGGPQSANDETAQMREALARIKECVDREIPYLGICLGMQALVRAAGGMVVKNPVKEIGFRNPEDELFSIALTELGRRDPLFSGLDAELVTFQLNGEAVEIPEGLREHIGVLAVGKSCHNQVVKVGESAYGIQGHFELTTEFLKRLIHDDPDLASLDHQKIMQDFLGIELSYTQTCWQMIHNFLTIAGYK